jgi:general secretion pathway protein L
VNALLLFIAPDDRLAGWWVIADNDVAARGGPGDPLPDPPPERVIAVAPAAAVAIHSAELGTLAPAQARAAARLLVAEASLAPIDSQHVAVGPPDGAERPVAIVAAARLAGWLDVLARHGLDPEAVLPAPLVLPRPEAGFVRAAIGAETVVRGTATGFAEDPDVAPLVLGDAPVAAVDGEAALLAALAAPPLDLRQGPFARRNRFRIDWAHVRRLGWTGVAVATVTLLIGLVEIARLDAAADRATADAAAIAAAAAPGASPAMLEARLAALRGGGLGFTATAGALVAAVQATPNVELAALDFSSDGLLRATILAPGAADAEALRARLRAAGLAVEATPFQSEQGRIRGEFRIGGQ